jgi:poly-gamma-glutamate synthesis protein (capsule biosynthesis protein)
MSAAPDRRVTLMAVGDVGPTHEAGPGGYCHPETLALLERADLRFGQCERLYSHRGALQVGSGGGHTRLDPAMASVFTELGLDVVSVASNHSLDWGPDALLDTIARLRERGIQTVGAGADLAEARAPAVFERHGLRIAILGCCSVLRDGYAAGPASPGAAPLRARTYYEYMDFQPGVPPRIVTVPDEDDLAALCADVARAAADADVVVVSMHWGIHFLPKLLADYERIAAERVFAAGAHLVLGHHQHLPKGVGRYGDRICFHGLGNFIMSIPDPSPARIARMARDYGVRPDATRPRVPFGPDAVRTMVAQAVLVPGGAERVSFFPALVDEELRPEVLAPADPRFAEMQEYMAWASEGLGGRFEVRDGEVVVA